MGKNKKNKRGSGKKPSTFSLPAGLKKIIWGVVAFIVAIIITLSFFDSAGVAGQAIKTSLIFLIGQTVFLIPLILVLGGLVFFRGKYDKIFWPAVLAILLLIFGVAGILETLNLGEKQGGFIGFILTWPFLKLFGSLVTKIIFGGIVLAGILIFWHLLSPSRSRLQEQKEEELKKEKEPSLIKKIFAPKFKVSNIEPKIKEVPEKPQNPN